MRHLFTWIFVLCAWSGFSQQVLVLEKIGKGRYFTYQEGDMISLRTRVGNFHIYDAITRINDSAIVVGGNYSILLSDISYIEKSYRSRKNNGIKVMIAGGILVGITSINNISHNKQVIDPLFLSIGVGLAAAGGLWYSFGTRRYPVGVKWKLKVLDGFLD